MASTFDDTVLDFDLNFLQQPPTVVNDYKYDKQRKSILIAKKKTIATDSLIRKYYAKNEQFEQTEVLLLAAKEECKQVCIDYKETLEKCTQVEQDAVKLKARNKELEDSNILLQNQCEAIKSHANQLQVLVNEHETTIEGLKIEKQLNKNNTTDSETKLTELQNENETLLKHLCLIRDIVLGKKKLKKHHKLLLKKYNKFKYNSDGEEEESAEENLFFDSLPLSPMSVNDTENKKEVAFNVNRNSNLVKKVIEDHESDCSNEVVSEDTGRGSSLAFSDGEKCFNSPDYFQNDSPFATDATKVKDKRTFADIGTNPIHKEFKHAGTSPIIFEEEIILKIDKGVQVECDVTEVQIISNAITEENNKLINRATSPIPDMDTSPSSVLSKDVEKVLIDKGIQVDSDTKKKHIMSDVIVKEKNELIDRATSPIADVESSAISKDFEKVSDSIYTLQPATEMLQPAKSLFLCEESELSNSSDVAMNAVSQDDVSINENEQEPADKKEKCLSETHRENSVNTSQPTQINIQDLTSQCEIEFSNNSSSIKEKNCLERHNSNNISNEGIDDIEIEMILNTMRLTERLLTPIPKTPVKLSRKKSKQLISPVPEKSEPLNGHKGCVEALKIKEENKYLKSSICDLSKEIMKIKRILKNQMLMPESPKNDENTTIISDLTEYSSQETLVKNVKSNVNKIVDLSDDLPLSEWILKEKESKILKNVKTGVRMSSRKHDSTDNTECTDNMLVADTNESGKKNDSHTGKNNSRTNNHEEYNINNDNEIISQDHSNEFSNAETMDTGLRKRKMNAIKLSRLEKFRKKLLPKGKIGRIKAPVRKLQTKPKTREKLVNENNLNNKTAYEKAVNVMKELKLKEISKEIDVSKLKKQSETESKKKDHNEAVAFNKDLAKSSECSPNKAVHIAQHSLSKEDSLQIVSQINLDAVTNKNSRHECTSETNQNDFKIAHSPQHDTLRNCITTRSQSKMSDQESIISSRRSSIESMTKCTELFGPNEGTPSRKRKQSDFEDSSEISCKRVRRNFNVREIVNDHSAQNQSSEFIHKMPQKRKYTEIENSPKSYPQKDSKLFAKCNEPLSEHGISKELNDSCFDENRPKQSILCKMIDKYGKATIRFTAKKVPDGISNAICKKLEDNIAHIIELPPEKAKPAMSKLVEDIQTNFNLKNFLCGFLKYLKDPARKVELFNKVASPPAPPMSKSEQVILYIVKQLCVSVPNIVSIILKQMEFSLFQLNKTPEFDVIESLSHVYALICRYFGLKMRLRLFILDAMYCLSFKVVPLIKQCLDVWMHILPLAHMGLAKTPLVTCLVYLLHFYKCEDHLNRVQDIRGILYRKYFYQITEWNEPKMLELFRTAILEIRDISIEKKTLRLALIILAKRQGPVWCQKNIIKKMLMPLIEKEDMPLRVKQFSIEMLGPLLKPYPADMKLHCEIVVNNLLDMLDLNPQDSLKEAIFTSLIYMSKHNQNRVFQALLSWSPKQVTPEFELLLKDYVQEKSLKVWKGLLSRIIF